MTPTDERHQAMYQELALVLKKHAEKMTAREVLAVLSNMVGKALAMQDQRTTTKHQALRIVQRNIEIGNAQMIEEVSGAPKGSA